MLRVTRSINVGKSRTHISISLDSCADLLRAGGHRELGLTLHASIQSLLGQGGRPAHVLVARVGAATDQTCRRRVPCL